MASSLKYVISHALALTHFIKTRWSYVCCYLRLTVNRQSSEFEVALCDLNSEKAWWEWTSKAINGVLDKQEELLSQMRSIATAPPLERMEEAICDLGQRVRLKAPDLALGSEQSGFLPKRYNSTFFLH